MRADEAAKILLVRAIEEIDPAAAASPEAERAASEAVEGGDETGWLLHRAEHRLRGDLAAYRPLLAVATAPHVPALALLVPFAIGLGSNWLAATTRIHVLYNPIAVLVAWNLGLYAALVLAPLALRRRSRRAPPSHVAAQAEPAAGAQRPRGVRGFLLRRMTPTLWLRVRRAAETGALTARSLGQVARRFWSLWVDAAGAIPLARLRGVLHGAAAALAIGAVAGMFVRGVFFEYAMVWRSTFVRDPEMVATLLRVALGPAAWLLGRPLPSVADAEAMFGAEGVPAAPWIGLWAVTAALFVVAPRLALTLAAALRRRLLARRVEIGLEDGYFETLLAGVRRAEIERIQTAIDADVRAAAERLVGSIADLVCERLYDARLVPRLRAFRDTGGSVEALEAEMAAECEAFQPELDAALDAARGALETDLRAAVERSVGRGLDRAHAHDVSIGVEDVPVGALGGAIGREISNAVGAAVSTGVGLVVATVSGGFGHHLGAALLVTLLHTTGPVGFLIGGIGGLAMAVAGWYLGRDRIANGMRGVRLPRAVARIALRDRALAKLVAEGRAQCHQAVRAKLDEEIAPLVPRLAEEIWASLRPALARAGRRASGEGR